MALLSHSYYIFGVICPSCMDSWLPWKVRINLNVTMVYSSAMGYFVEKRSLRWLLVLVVYPVGRARSRSPCLPTALEPILSNLWWELSSTPGSERSAAGWTTEDCCTAR